MSDQDGFENALEAMILADDWDGWLVQRAIYADLLKEQNHPLEFWARSVAHRQVISRREGGYRGGEVLSWHLWFEVNPEASKSPGSWFLKKGHQDWRKGPAKLSVNFHRTLGFPPTQLRYTRKDGCLHKFTFKPGKPRVSPETMAKLRPDSNSTERARACVYQAFDTSICPLGYAAMFLPHWYRAPSDGPEQKTLFEAENMEGE